jgi:hypothetical protein
MKTILYCLLFSFLFLSGYSQEKTKKQIREESKLEKQKQIDSLINSKTFVFTAQKAYPQGSPSVDLATHPNYMKFFPDSIASDMPFFGRGFSGIGYGGDSGLKFEERTLEFTLTKTKKEYRIEAAVKGKNDTFHIYLSVSFEGSASLSINSNNRSTISYNGRISATELKE